jgi:hypothetical protein
MRQKILLLVVVLIVAFIGLAGLSWHANHQKESLIHHTSDTFVNDVLADNPNASYSLLTSSAKQSLSSTTWTGTVDKLYATFVGKHPSYTGLTLSGTSATVSYKISGVDGNYDFNVALISSGKTWQVQSFISKLQH